MKKPETKSKAGSKSAAVDEVDWEVFRKFEEATAWLKHLNAAPKVSGLIDLYSQNPHAIALRSIGITYVRLLKSLAAAGQRDALLQLVWHACELTDLLEEIADSQPALLPEFARKRANWPVMLGRHETSNKLVSAYLDRIRLGANCVINADGRKVAKYSLRTPINRFVWRVLKELPLSILLARDKDWVKRMDYDTLPSLTKAYAKTWADRAIMPHIEAMYPNFSEVPELKSILRRPGVRTPGQQRREIRKDVIRALQSLAPPA